MPAQNIRIRLKAYDHKLLDKSAQEIVSTVQRSRSYPPADQNQQVLRLAWTPRGQEEP